MVIGQKAWQWSITSFHSLTSKCKLKIKTRDRFVSEMTYTVSSGTLNSTILILEIVENGMVDFLRCSCSVAMVADNGTVFEILKPQKLAFP